MTNPQTSQNRRPNYTGSLFEVSRTLPNRNPYTSWRATGYLSVGEKHVKIIGEGKTAAAATAALERNRTRKQIAIGQAGPELLELTRKDKAHALASVLTEWLADRQPPVLRLNVYKAYDAKIRNYLIPLLGDEPVRLLNHQSLNKFFRETLPNISKPDGTPRLGGVAQWQTYSILDLALTYAVAHKYLDTNPLANVRPPKKGGSTKVRANQLKQAAQWVPQQVMKTVNGTQPRELRWYLAFVGLRQSEVLGLTDDCLLPNIKNPNRIAIKQQLDRITMTHGCGPYDSVSRKWKCGDFADRCSNPIGSTSLFIREEVKTASGDRELPLDPTLKLLVKRHLAYRDELRESSDWEPLPGTKMDTLIFTKSNGRPIRPQDDRRDWHRVLEEAHADKYDLRVHDARHLAATIAIQQGFDRTKLRLIFGWSPRNIDEMIALYGNPSAKMLTPEMETFSSILTEYIK